MTQPEQNDRVTFESVLKLVEQLAPDEQEKLGQTLNKLQALRKAADSDLQLQVQGASTAKALEPLLARCETALLSEQALAVDWLKPEEDEAWSRLSSAE